MKRQTGGTGWPSGNILDLPTYVMSPKIFEKVQKKLGEQDVRLALPVILLGEHLHPLLPLYPRLWEVDATCVQFGSWGKFHPQGGEFSQIYALESLRIDRHISAEGESLRHWRWGMGTDAPATAFPR